MKKGFYISIVALIFSSCTLLIEYKPIESSNYSVSDEYIIYLTDKLIIKVKGDFHYYDQPPLLNYSNFEIEISSKVDSIKFLLDDIVLNDITNYKVFNLDNVYFYNQKGFLKDGKSMIKNSISVYPNSTAKFSFQFSKEDNVFANLVYFAADLEIRKIMLNETAIDVPIFHFKTF
ncbi:MAG: hypothetical protein HS131_12325 [Ignavibacteriales bacterium]|nr:hypothetical protein [Ignavibacteriales bacterium]